MLNRPIKLLCSPTYGVQVRLAVQAKRENDTVYFQRVPAELPRLVEGRRLVNATPLVLPQPPESLRELFSLDAFAASPTTVREAPPGPAAPASTSAAVAPAVAGAAYDS